MLGTMIELPVGTTTLLLAEIRVASRAEIQSRILLREDLDEDLSAAEHAEIELAAREQFDELLADALQAHQGRLARFRDGLLLFHELGDRRGVAECLAGLASSRSASTTPHRRPMRTGVATVPAD